MRIVNIHKAKTLFSKLVDAVICGDEILIAVEGKLVAKLGPVYKKSLRKFGVLKGKIKVARDFDAPLSETLLSDFEK